MEKISVAVRFRPSIGQDSSGERHWKLEDNRISLHRPLGTPVSGVPPFAFDHVFDHGSTNSTVYDLLTKSIIHAAVHGFNGTAFAYGQTSSGKTFTMNGSQNDPGIIHLAVQDIFLTTQMITDREFLIRVSYMEIYNEEINDLLSLGNQKLQIHESLERGIFVAGLREEIVNSAEQVLELLKLGEANRHFGETNMNVRSSRSHTIFRMVIESSTKDPISSGDISNADAIRVSVLNLVDLAGSERIAKTGAGGVRLKEGKHINKSLMVLGNVINKLSDSGKQRGHVPYRDSKLTRILQPALGGNAKTSIICTVAPEEVHIEETKGTLQFASRAKRITNCAQVNEILTDAALLKRQKLEIEELRGKLQGSHSEVLEQVILKQRNDMLKSELEREKLAVELEEERRSREALEHCIREQQKKINDLITLSISDRDGSSTQERISSKEICEEVFSNIHTMSQGNAFKTPSFKAMPNNFVVRRSNYSAVVNSSPIPENFANVADEDMWLRMNKGCTTDLDMLQMTPNVKYQQLTSSDKFLGLAFEEDASIKERCHSLETECSLNRQQLETSKEQCAVPEGEYILLREEKASLSQPLDMSLKERCHSLEIECSLNRQQLETSKEHCAVLEGECNLLREEKASLVQALSMSKQNVELLTGQKDELLKDLNIEKQKMKDLKEEIMLFSLAFAQREGRLTSIYTKTKVMVETLKTCQVPIPELRKI